MFRKLRIPKQVLLRRRSRALQAEEKHGIISERSCVYFPAPPTGGNAARSSGGDFGMRVGLVLEGGAMRGMFTAGVLDVLMENGICLDGAAGVSAGAVFGCNYKSHQIGRAIRYNKAYCGDRRYFSLSSWLRTGNLYNVSFGYHTLPRELDVFDQAAFAADPMPFWVVCTDAETGKPVYHLCGDGGEEDVTWMRASASMPLAARPVEIGGRKLLDGGISDSIPLRFMERQGYERNIAVLTQPPGFVKQKNGAIPLVRLALRAYPMVAETLKTRHLAYNETLRYVAESEAAGRTLVIRPPKALGVGAVERDPDKLETVYRLGRTEAEKHLESIRQFIRSGREAP